MAKKAKQSTRRYDVADLVELVGALQNIRNGNGHGIVDPTVNVKSDIAASKERLDDLRVNDRMWRDRLDSQTEKWRDKLDAVESRANSTALVAEARRLDALLAANTSNVALALEKQGAQAQAQDRRIAVLEQNQYQSGGKDIQRTEARGQSNVDRSLIVSIILAAGAIAAAVIYHH